MRICASGAPPDAYAFVSPNRGYFRGIGLRFVAPQLFSANRAPFRQICVFSHVSDSVWPRWTYFRQIKLCFAGPKFFPPNRTCFGKPGLFSPNQASFRRIGRAALSAWPSSAPIMCASPFPTSVVLNGRRVRLSTVGRVGDAAHREPDLSQVGVDGHLDPLPKRGANEARHDLGVVEHPEGVGQELAHLHGACKEGLGGMGHGVWGGWRLPTKAQGWAGRSCPAAMASRSSSEDWPAHLRVSIHWQSSGEWGRPLNRARTRRK
jgi:hypothetical protein